MVAEWTEVLKGVRIGWDAVDAITKTTGKVWHFLAYWVNEFPFNSFNIGSNCNILPSVSPILELLIDYVRTFVNTVEAPPVLMDMAATNSLQASEEAYMSKLNISEALLIVITHLVSLPLLPLSLLLLLLLPLPLPLPHHPSQSASQDPNSAFQNHFRRYPLAVC